MNHEVHLEKMREEYRRGFQDGVLSAKAVVLDLQSGKFGDVADMTFCGLTVHQVIKLKEYYEAQTGKRAEYL